MMAVRDRVAGRRASDNTELGRGAACRVAAAAGHHGPWLTGIRRCGQSGQGTVESRPGRDGLCLPTRGSALARGAPKHGDAEFPHEVTAHTGTASPRHAMCTNFKACVATNPCELTLNHLCYITENTLGYRKEITRDTIF